MDTRTGKLHYNISAEDMKNLDMKEIEQSDMTSKQAETMQVSKYDSRSVLGQMFTGCRAERRKAMKEARRNQKHANKRKLKSLKIG